MITILCNLISIFTFSFKAIENGNYSNGSSSIFVLSELQQAQIEYHVAVIFYSAGMLCIAVVLVALVHITKLHPKMNNFFTNTFTGTLIALAFVIFQVMAMLHFGNHSYALAQILTEIFQFKFSYLRVLF